MIMNYDTLEEMRKPIIKKSEIKSSILSTGLPETFVKKHSKSISSQIEKCNKSVPPLIKREPRKSRRDLYEEEKALSHYLNSPKSLK